MKKKNTKKEVLNICIQKQEEQVENFDSRVTAMKLDINNKDYSASQSEDRQADKIELLKIYENELTLSTNDLHYLKTLNPIAKYSTVQAGALVVTSEIIFFIAISTEKFEIEGATVIGMSVRAPIYNAMEGLAKGDSFKFNEMEYHIDELY